MSLRTPTRKSQKQIHQTADSIPFKRIAYTVFTCYIAAFVLGLFVDYNNYLSLSIIHYTQQLLIKGSKIFFHVPAAPAYLVFGPAPHAVSK